MSFFKDEYMDDVCNIIFNSNYTKKDENGVYVFFEEDFICDHSKPGAPPYDYDKLRMYMMKLIKHFGITFKYYDLGVSLYSPPEIYKDDDTSNNEQF